MEKLPSGLSEYISDEESLARFLNSSKQFNAGGLVKPAALLPHNGETSVFRYSLDSNGANENLWRTGKSILPPGRQLYGAAFIQGSDIRKIGLEIQAKEPPPRHANIVNWPGDNDRILEKARQKELAILLASNALFRKKP